MSLAVVPQVAGIGPPEILLILLVILLLFGAKKLPELARGSGRALRIFKAETKGLHDGDEEAKTEEQKQVDSQTSAPEARPVETPAEQRRSDPDS